MIKGYFNIASLFKNYFFYLNEGTRQADSTSCITDSICILKEALQLKEILILIKSKTYDTHPAFLPTRFFSRPRPPNFQLFKMPEQFLITAQRPNYVEGSDLTVILRGGKSLKQYRELYKIKILKGETETVLDINSYLFIKPKQHKEIFDRLDAINKEILDTVKLK